MIKGLNRGMKLNSCAISARTSPFSQRSFELTQLEVLADATQQLYLSLPSWSEWLDTEWKKRRQKQTRRKAESQKAGD